MKIKGNYSVNLDNFANNQANFYPQLVLLNFWQIYAIIFKPIFLLQRFKFGSR
jgi:hypothetical protein